jgi:RNA polymerase sigma-70 factor, ECF subfamily
MGNGNESSGPAWCERLYEASAARLILYGRALGLSHSEAEDVLHELFAALLRAQQLPEQPEHYCVRAYRNRALNYRRGLWRRLRRELESRDWFDQAQPTEGLDRAVRRQLARLPMAQREAIVLKFWHGYTFQQIGQILGLSPNTVASRYRYGIDQLKIALHGANYGDSPLARESDADLDPASTLCET